MAGASLRYAVDFLLHRAWTSTPGRKHCLTLRPGLVCLQSYQLRTSHTDRAREADSLEERLRSRLSGRVAPKQQAIRFVVEAEAMLARTPLQQRSGLRFPNSLLMPVLRSRGTAPEPRIKALRHGLVYV